MKKLDMMVDGKLIKCGCYEDTKDNLVMCKKHQSEWQEVHDRWVADHNMTPEEWVTHLAKIQEDNKKNPPTI